MYLQLLRCDRRAGATKFEVLLEICPIALENFVSVPAIAASLQKASFNVPDYHYISCLEQIREDRRARREIQTYCYQLRRQLRCVREVCSSNISKEMVC